MRAVLVLCLVACMGMPLCSGLEDGRIGVLYLSDPIRAAGFNLMRAEPIFSLIFVASSLRGFGGWDLEDVHRAIRLYLPRTYEQILENFDVITFDNANRNAFTDLQIELLARAARAGGRGLVMTGGWESFGGTGSSEPPWGTTAIGELLPTQEVENTWVEGGRLVILEADHEFVASIPWERKSPFMISFHHNLVSVRAGAQLLAITDRNTYQYGGKEHPLFITWDLPGSTRSFACTGEIAQMGSTFSYGGVGYTPWDYFIDFTSNLMIYAARRPVPQDVDLVHSVRSKGFEILTRDSLLLSLLEFIEGFGANTQSLMRELDEVNDMVSAARQDYIELRFEEVLEAYDEIGDVLEDLEKRALELKDRALLWVYLIEYLAVTGTSLVAGFVLWSFMVRRRYYREMGVTRVSGIYE